MLRNFRYSWKLERNEAYHWALPFIVTEKNIYEYSLDLTAGAGAKFEKDFYKSQIYFGTIWLR